ncbi:PilW family protein [Sedimentibacter sp. MB31-C6]|uniref:PilW family protein n=1 Tax=Sedimentibacter sp. MB31-C6 TaxID=3109366 RepID=UPI002DDD3C8E|nr:type II secretion system protein [Sedimentibacter sp. MB36-C1]WSI03811.1 type II secretion system protein [Sedimentibacter sp. MB36-C1]
MITKEKGFTLIEIIIALGLLSIIICLSINFLIFNFTNYRKISNDAEIRFQAYYILNFMNNKILESSYLELAQNGTVKINNISGEQIVTRLSFRYGDDNNECYIFEYRNNKLFYGKGDAFSSANSELGTYIKEVRVRPIPENMTLSEARAIIIKINFIKDEQKYESEQLICMRNR